MISEKNVNNLNNKLPDITDYTSLVEHVKNCGYDTTLRINDLLSEAELKQLEKEYNTIEEEFKEQTGLNKTDVAFIIIAVLLQMTRQFLQRSLNFDAFKSKENRDDDKKSASKAKENYDNEKADKKKKKLKLTKQKALGITMLL